MLNLLTSFTNLPALSYANPRISSTLRSKRLDEEVIMSTLLVISSYTSFNESRSTAGRLPRHISRMVLN